MSLSLYTATPAQAAMVWPAARAAHLFEEQAAFERFHAEAPWRVQVTERGEAVVVERWRAHLDVLAIRGMWCSARQVPEMVQAVAHLASRQGFGRVLSPLVDEEAVRDYERAGMHRHSEVVVLVREGARRSVAPSVEPPDGVTVRLALESDLDSLLALDGACFDEFWRYDGDRLATFFAGDRIDVAEEEGRLIGYTLCTSTGESGSVGRLAVLPDARRRGVARALLAAVIGYFARVGIERVTLCTQVDNDASRELYRDVGFRELPGKRVFLTRPATPVEDRG